MKRNLCAKFATGDIIIHMDDDNYYPASSVMTRVKAVSMKKPCVGCTEINNFYPKKMISFKSQLQSRKSIEQQTCMSTLAYPKQFWEKQKFDNQDIDNEGIVFFKGRGGKIKEIDVNGIVVVLLHKGNYVPYPEIVKGEANGWHFGEIDSTLFEFIGKVE